MDKEKRLEKEKEFIPINIQPMSVCCGEFKTSKKKEPEICKHRDKCFKYQRMKQHKKNVGEVSFHYVDTFRDCKLWNDVVDSSTITHYAIYNILYCNEIALLAVYDLQEYVRKGIWEKDTQMKKMLGAIDKRVERYEGMIQEIVRDRMEFLYNFNYSMDRFIEAEVEEWKSCLRNCLERYNMPDARMMADIEIARTLVGYSVCSAKKRISECCRYDKDCISLFSYTLAFKSPENNYDDWNIFKVIEDISEWAERHLKSCELDLNKEKDVMDAYRKMDRALTDRFHISQALYEAEILCTKK